MKISEYLDIDYIVPISNNMNDANHSRNLHKNLLFEMGNKKYELLNDEQREIVDNVLNLTSKLEDHIISDDSNNCILMTGIEGSGKTFVYDTLWHILNGEDKSVCSMAFTGIAATLLPDEKTIHKVLKLPVPIKTSLIGKSKFGVSGSAISHNCRRDNYR